jgi:hypothetical protein
VKSELKILLERDLDFSNVRYYTLKFDDEDKTELKKFYDKYQQEFLDSINFIKMWIAVIGEEFSATPQYFRPEDNASALPPPTKEIRHLGFDIGAKKMNLRLYCIVLSPEIVILVNGGIKESDATSGSPSCWEQYMLTSNISSQLNKMKKDGHLTLKGKMLKRSKLFKLTFQK